MKKIIYYIFMAVGVIIANITQNEDSHANEEKDGDHIHKLYEKKMLYFSDIINSVITDNDSDDSYILAAHRSHSSHSSHSSGSYHRSHTSHKSGHSHFSSHSSHYSGTYSKNIPAAPTISEKTIPTLSIREEHPATLIKIIDGKSVLVSVKNQEYNVILYGINTPEKGHHLETPAKELLQNMLAGKDLFVFPLASDEEGSLSLLSAGNDSVNAALIGAGYAKVDPTCSQSFCTKWRTIEAEAKKAKRGIWAQ